MGGFSILAYETASTKRPPAIASGKRGDPVENIASLFCIPLAPIDPNVTLRLGLDTPHELLQTFVDDGLDILEGDTLTVSGVDYPIKAVGDWPWRPGGTTRLRLILEDLKT